MPPSENKLPVEWVTTDIIRQHFNSGKYFERVKSGELTEFAKRNSHPNNPPKGEPFCTRSQISYYCTQEGETVAIVHQYLRPDGEIGASGLPDPKRIILEDRIISIRTVPKKNE